MITTTHSRFLASTALMFLGAAAIPASAALITIQNASFEAPAVSDGAIGGTPASWTGGGQVINPSTLQTTGGAVPNGTQAAQFQPGTPFASSLTQSLGVSLLPSTTYTLTLSVGDRLTLPFAGYTVKLTAGATPTTLAELTSTAPGATLPADGGFALVTLVYTSPSSVTANQTLGISLAEVETSTTGNPRTLMDNLVLDATPVPEPATLGAAGVAAIGLLSRRRRIAR